MKKAAYFLLGFLIPFILVAITHADSIILKNGKVIETQGAWEENGYVKFFKDGKIHSGFPKSQVERIETSDGKHDAPVTLEGLIENYGKIKMVSVILEKRNQMITLDMRNLKNKIGDQPVIESVTPETIRMDLDSIGLSLAELKDLLQKDVSQKN